MLYIKAKEYVFHTVWHRGGPLAVHGPGGMPKIEAPKVKRRKEVQGDSEIRDQICFPLVREEYRASALRVLTMSCK